MDNTVKENIFFLIDIESKQDDKQNNKEENINLLNLLDDINNDIEFDFVNQMNNLSNEKIFELMCYEYKINYTVKELLIICDYYEIAKEIKNNKYNKEEIINALVHFENNPINDEIFMRRQSMWYYIDKLKNDKFMKKYVLW
jgi:hypothetical protein